MKKKLLLVLCVCCSLLFTACGDLTSQEWINKYAADILDANQVTEESTSANQTTYYYQLTSNVEFDADEIVDQSYSDCGIIVVKNKQGYYGFYSLLHGKYLIERKFVNDNFYYNIVEDDNIGYILYIYYLGTHYYYDALGNTIYSGYEQANIATMFIQNIIYVSVVAEGSNDYKLYEYVGDKLVATSKTLEELEKLDKLEENLDDDDIEIQSSGKYIDINRHTLDIKGYDGYYYSQTGNLRTVFNSKNEFVSQYSIPEDTELFQIGDKLVYQKYYDVPDDATNYSYFSNDKKYVLETKCVNIISGKESTLSLNYIILEGSALKNAKGKYENAYLAIRKINKSKHIEDLKVIIVNNKFEELADFTDYSTGNMEKLGNNFYNTELKVLFDRKLNVISHLSAVNPRYIPGKNYLKCSRDGKYGLIDSNGNVVVPFEYTEIDLENEVAGKMFAKKDGKFYVISANSSDKVALEDNASRVSTNLYLSTNTTSTKFNIYSLRGDLTGNINTDTNGNVTPKDSDSSYNCRLYSNKFFKFKRTVEQSNSNNVTKYRFVAVSNKPVVNKETFETIGTEETVAAEVRQMGAGVFNLEGNKTVRYINMPIEDYDIFSTFESTTTLSLTSGDASKNFVIRILDESKNELYSFTSNAGVVTGKVNLNLLRLFYYEITADSDCSITMAGIPVYLFASTNLVKSNNTYAMNTEEQNPEGVIVIYAIDATVKFNYNLSYTDNTSVTVEYLVVNGYDLSYLDDSYFDTHETSNLQLGNHSFEQSLNNQTIVIRIKNEGSSKVNFSISNLEVIENQ